MPKYFPLPNGAVFEVADDVDYATAEQMAQAKFPKLFGLEKKGIGAALGQGLESLLSSGQTAFGALTGSPEEAAAAGRKRQEMAGLKYADQIGLDLLKKKYEEEGILAAGKELARQVPLAIAEQAPNIGATLAAGRAGAMAGGVFGPAGAVIGGLGGAALPSLIQQFGGNIERQAAEGKPIDVRAAGAAAAPQAALDVAGTFIPFGRTLIGKALGPQIEKALARGATGAAEKMAQESLKKTLLKGTAIGGAAEIPTEVAQQMLERLQAGLPLTSEDALAEYGDTAYQVGLLAPLGALGRVSDRAAARKEVATKQAEEAQAAADKAEAERLASPEYYDELQAERDKLAARVSKMEAGLPKSKNPEKLQEQIDGVRFNLDAAEQRLAEHPLFQERQAKAYEQEQTAKTLGMFGEWQTQAQADEAQRQARAAQGIPSNVPALPGFEQPYTPVETQAAVAPAPYEQIKQEREVLKQRLDELEQQKSQAAIEGNTSVIAELDKQLKQIQGGYAEASRMLKEHPDAQLESLTKKLATAGETGDFETITKLAAQIEELKAKGAQNQAVPTYNQQQEALFTRQGKPTALATSAVKEGEKRLADQQKAAVEGALAQEEADLLAQQKKLPETAPQRQTRMYQQSLDQLEEEYAATADERMVGRLVDLFQKGGAKEEDSAEIADRSLQPQQNKFRSQEAGKAAEYAFADFAEAINDIKDGLYLGGEKSKFANTSKALLFKRAQRAKQAYLDAVLQQVDNDRLANRHNSLTQGQALQLAMQIHTAMDRNLKAGTIEPQLEQHLKQYAQPFYKPTTQVTFGLTMQTPKQLEAKAKREAAPTEQEIEAEKAAKRAAVPSELVRPVKTEPIPGAKEGELQGRPAAPMETERMRQRELPGIEPIATERATPANFMKFLNGAEVTKLRRNVDAEKAKTDEIRRLIKASIRADNAKYEAMKTKAEVETGKLREAIGDITELERKDAVYVAEQKLAEAIKKAEQDYMQGMEVLGPAINQAQRQLAEVEPNVTVAADRAMANKLRDWLNQAYDLRDRYASRVEELRNSRVEVDEHKVRRDAILSDYIQKRKKALDKLEAEVKNRPKGPVARKAEAERARLGAAEAKLKERNEQQTKLRREREQAALEFDNATSSYTQRVETAMAWDPNLGEYVVATGPKVQVGTIKERNKEGKIVEKPLYEKPIVQRKVVSGAPKSAATKREEMVAQQKETAKERIASKKANLERVLGGGAMTADRVANELNDVAKQLKSKTLKGDERKAVLKRQRDLKEYEKLIKVGRQVVRIAEAAPLKRGELRAARQERTEPQAKGEAPEVIGKATEERIKELGAEYKSLVGSIEERWGGDLLDEIGDLGYAIMDQVRGSALRDGGAKVREGVDLKSFKSLADKISAKLSKSGIKLRYYDNIDQAPAVVKAALAYHKANTTKGLILPDGSLTVIGDTHANQRDLEETIAHEVIGHYGVEGMLGAKGVQELTDKIFETDGLVYRVAEALDVWDEVRATEQSAIARGLNQNQQRVAMVRELIAHTAEKRGVPAGLVDVMKRWVKMLVNAVRNWMGRNGMDALTKATTADIQKLVYEAEKAYIQDRLPAYVSPNGQVAFRTAAEYAPSYNPRLASLTDKVVAKDKKLKDKILANATGLEFAIQFVDRFAGLENIAKSMKDQLAAFQMMYWNRTYDARNMVMAETATNGPREIKKQTRKDGKIEYVLDASGAPGLKDISEEVGKSKRVGNANATLREFGMYLTAKRAKRVGIDVAFGRNSSITPADLDEVIRAGDADPHFKKGAEMYAKYNKGLMNFLAQSGAISQAQADAMTKYNDYVGFYREKDGHIVDGEHAITIGDLTNNKFLKELIGSDQAIVDFRTSSLQNTALVTDIALRNQAMKDTVNTLKGLGMAKIMPGKGPARSDVVRFKHDGKDYYAVIDTDTMAGIPADLIVKGLEGVSTSLPAAIRFMQGPANLLRKGVTRMPLYAVRQIVRDSLASVMTGGVDAKPVMSALKELPSLMRGDNETERLLQAKGFIGGQVFSATPDDQKRIMADIAAGKDHWTTLMSKLDHVAMKADAASRVTAYNSYIKQGMSDMEASLAALEMMNFTKRGISPSMMAISNMIPFFNAQVQGLNVLYKAFKGTSLAGKKLEIQGKLLKRGALMMGLSLAYAALMSDDEAYKNATPEEKYNNWFVRLPGVEEPVRVPIPFELGYIFKALPEALYNLAATDEKADETLKAFKQMAINTIPGGSNLLLPQALKPAVEAVANYNFFTGKPIEGARMSSVTPGKRATEGTTEVSKALGDLLGVSPIKIDYLIRGYTGGLGAALVALANPVLASPEKPGTPEKKLSELPFIGQAFQPNDGRGIVNEAFDTMERVNQAKGTVNNLIERGMLDEAKEFQKDNAKLIAASSMAGSFRQKMGEYAKQKRQIAGSRQLTPEQKRTAIDAIKQKEIALAKQLRSIE